MNLKDLSDNSRRILAALYQTPTARRKIAALCQLDVMKVSRDLNRLEGLGFVEKPSEFGGDWQISEQGRLLFGGAVPMIVATAPAEPAPHPKESDPGAEPIQAQEEPPPVTEPFTEPVTTDDIAQSLATDDFLGWIAEEQELNVALDEIIARIGSPRIPASALRTYRRLLDHLPPPVQKSLSPITRFLEVQS